MFTKILIANRGEIACRIMRTAKRLGIATVAVYSTIDADSLHVGMADQAFWIGDSEALQSYLNAPAIIKIALESGAKAIHPGYGFLSENTEFAIACEQAGLIFIGPSVEAMQAMASKQLAKQSLEKTWVPLTPGYHGLEQHEACLLKEAKKIGFPILLKAASGGGGKGMRTVEHEAEFKQALASAKREAKSSFADDTMIIEKLVFEPRHVEIQIMADNHGHIIHLFERDCSIQRRHQKVIEEAPATHLKLELREQLAQAAIEVARTIGYRGAGTVEFLVASDNTFYFMEMNTRLQVEHPVTEMITGLDLVEWQLRIAANEPLPLSQEQIQSHGHAIECRIYAEDPEHDFLPSIGLVRFLKEPPLEYVRIETAVSANTLISRYYDPMLAKLIAWGETREEARNRLQLALDQYHIGGVKTNLAFLHAIFSQPRFIENKISTHFLSQCQIKLPKPDRALAIQLAAALDYLDLATKSDPLYYDTFAWQMHLKSRWTCSYLIEGVRFDVAVTPVAHTTVELTCLPPINKPDGAKEQPLDSQHNHCERELTSQNLRLRLRATSDTLHFDDGQTVRHVFFERLDDKIVLYFNQNSIDIIRFTWQNNSSLSADNQLTAPMPGMVVAILKQPGEFIHAGEPLMVLEAMKMEHTICSPGDGIISHIFYEVGSQVDEGATLVALEQS